MEERDIQQDRPGIDFGVLLGYARSWIWEVDREGTYTHVYGNTRELIGFAPQELVGKCHFDELHPAEGREAFREKALGFFRRGERIVDLVNPVVCRDGAIRWMSTNGYPLRNEQGEVTGYRGLDNDITRRIEAEQILKASEDKWRSYIQHAPYGVCVVDGAGRYLEVSPEVCRITGYTEAELLRKSIRELTDPVDMEGAMGHFERVKSEGFAFGEYRFRKASGEIGWWSVAAKPIGPDRYIGYQMEVTDKVLKDRWQRRLLMALEQAMDGVAIADMDGRLMYINNSWLEQHGMAGMDLTGQSLAVFHSPEQMETEIRPSLEQLRTTGRETIELRHLRKDGEEFLMSMNTAVVHDEEGEDIGMIAIGRDLTETRRQEEEREKLINKLLSINRDLGQFSYITAHNFRGPLTNLFSLCELARIEAGADTPMAELLAGIEASSRQLEQTLDELNRILSIKTKPLHQPGRIRFVDAFQTAQKAYAPNLEAIGATVETDFHKAEAVFFDADYLTNIFHHLLANAIRFRSRARALVIHVESRLREERVEVRFSDNGQGIDTEAIGERLFGLHQRFHENSATRGVGLYLVKTQLNALGADVRADGKPGKGVCFTMTFDPA